MTLSQTLGEKEQKTKQNKNLRTWNMRKNTVWDAE
jgi:hypothetical protein